jgi:hypothetical protein
MRVWEDDETAMDLVHDGALIHTSLTQLQQDVAGRRTVCPLRETQIVPLRTDDDIKQFENCSKLVSSEGYHNGPRTCNTTQALFIFIMDLYDGALH